MPASRPRMSPATARAVGLAVGMVADQVWADPRRAHPVAGFGRAAAAIERRLYADGVVSGVASGIAFTTACVGSVAGLGVLVDRATRARPAARILLTAVATWSVLGGTSLAREGTAMARLLDAGDVDAARVRLSHLCARDAQGMGPPDLARASVESLAENASDAVVAPLIWGALTGVGGLLGYRAANTLDAMVGYRSVRYAHFGWASARLDDALNMIPARVTGVLMALCAPVVGGSTSTALRVLRRDGGMHPSPNAGRPEAAAAGALGVALGGANAYGGHVEHRPVLGEGGRTPRSTDVGRAVRLGRACSTAGGAICVAAALARGRRMPDVGVPSRARK